MIKAESNFMKKIAVEQDEKCVIEFWGGIGL